LAQVGTKIFLQTGLDWWKQIDPTGEFFPNRNSRLRLLDGANSTARPVATPKLEGTVVEAPLRFVGPVEQCPLSEPKPTSLCDDKTSAFDPN
jgi:hypothetical protein